MNSQMIRFRNDLKRKDHDLDVWKVFNFIETETKLSLKGTIKGDTCEVIKKIIKDERGEEEINYEGQ